MRAAIPGLPSIPAPTMETFATSLSMRTEEALIFSAMRSTTCFASGASMEATVKIISVMFDSALRRLCTIISTSMFASASAEKISCATPGTLATPRTATFETCSSCVTPRMIKDFSSTVYSSLMIVPGSVVNVERTWMGILYSCPISTERGCMTPAPRRAISSISL